MPSARSIIFLENSELIERCIYVFNGKEKDDEMHGEGNSYTAEFWEYDSRLGRRWNVDPVTNSNQSSYSVMLGNPIWYGDPTGAVVDPGDKGTRNYNRNMRKYNRLYGKNEKFTQEYDRLNALPEVYKMRKNNFPGVENLRNGGTVSQDCDGTNYWNYSNTMGGSINMSVSSTSKYAPGDPKMREFHDNYDVGFADSKAATFWSKVFKKRDTYEVPITSQGQITFVPDEHPDRIEIFYQGVKIFDSGMQGTDDADQNFVINMCQFPGFTSGTVVIKVVKGQPTTGDVYAHPTTTPDANTAQQHHKPAMLKNRVKRKWVQ